MSHSPITHDEYEADLRLSTSIHFNFIPNKAWKTPKTFSLPSEGYQAKF